MCNNCFVVKYISCIQNAQRTSSDLKGWLWLFAKIGTESATGCTNSAEELGVLTQVLTICRSSLLIVDSSARDVLLLARGKSLQELFLEFSSNSHTTFRKT